MSNGAQNPIVTMDEWQKRMREQKSKDRESKDASAQTLHSFRGVATGTNNDSKEEATTTGAAVTMNMEDWQKRQRDEKLKERERKSASAQTLHGYGLPTEKTKNNNQSSAETSSHIHIPPNAEIEVPEMVSARNLRGLFDKKVPEKETKSGAPVTVNMQDWEMNLRNQRSSEIEKKKTSAQNLHTYRGPTISDDDLKLTAIRQEEREKKKVAEENLRNYGRPGKPGESSTRVVPNAVSTSYHNTSNHAVRNQSAAAAKEIESAVDSSGIWCEEEQLVIQGFMMSSTTKPSKKQLLGDQLIQLNKRAKNSYDGKKWKTDSNKFSTNLQPASNNKNNQTSGGSNEPSRVILEENNLMLATFVPSEESSTGSIPSKPQHHETSNKNTKKKDKPEKQAQGKPKAQNRGIQAASEDTQEKTKVCGKQNVDTDQKTKSLNEVLNCDPDLNGIISHLGSVLHDSKCMRNINDNSLCQLQQTNVSDEKNFNHKSIFLKSQAGVPSVLQYDAFEVSLAMISGSSTLPSKEEKLTLKPTSTKSHQSNNNDNNKDNNKKNVIKGTVKKQPAAEQGMESAVESSGIWCEEEQLIIQGFMLSSESKPSKKLVPGCQLIQLNKEATNNHDGKRTKTESSKFSATLQPVSNNISKRTSVDSNEPSRVVLEENNLILATFASSEESSFVLSKPQHHETANKNTKKAEVKPEKQAKGKPKAQNREIKATTEGTQEKINGDEKQSVDANHKTENKNDGYFVPESFNEVVNCDPDLNRIIFQLGSSLSDSKCMRNVKDNNLCPLRPGRVSDVRTKNNKSIFLKSLSRVPSVLRYDVLEVSLTIASGSSTRQSKAEELLQEADQSFSPKSTTIDVSEAKSPKPTTEVLSKPSTEKKIVHASTKEVVQEKVTTKESVAWFEEENLIILHNISAATTNQKQSFKKVLVDEQLIHLNNKKKKSPVRGETKTTFSTTTEQRNKEGNEANDSATRRIILEENNLMLQNFLQETQPIADTTLPIEKHENGSKTKETKIKSEIQVKDNEEKSAATIKTREIVNNEDSPKIARVISVDDDLVPLVDEEPCQAKELTEKESKKVSSQRDVVPAPVANEMALPVDKKEPLENAEVGEAAEIEQARELPVVAPLHIKDNALGASKSVVAEIEVRERADIVQEELQVQANKSLVLDQSEPKETSPPEINLSALDDAESTVNSTREAPVDASSKADSLLEEAEFKESPTIAGSVIQAVKVDTPSTTTRDLSLESEKPLKEEVCESVDPLEQEAVVTSSSQSAREAKIIESSDSKESKNVEDKESENVKDKESEAVVTSSSQSAREAKKIESSDSKESNNVEDKERENVKDKESENVKDKESDGQRMNRDQIDAETEEVDNHSGIEKKLSLDTEPGKQVAAPDTPCRKSYRDVALDSAAQSLPFKPLSRSTRIHVPILPVTPDHKKAAQKQTSNDSACTDSVVPKPSNKSAPEKQFARHHVDEKRPDKALESEKEASQAPSVAVEGVLSAIEPEVGWSSREKKVGKARDSVNQTDVAKNPTTSSSRDSNFFSALVETVDNDLADENDSQKPSKDEKSKKNSKGRAKSSSPKPSRASQGKVNNKEVKGKTSVASRSLFDGGNPNDGYKSDSTSTEPKNILRKGKRKSHVPKPKQNENIDDDDEFLLNEIEKTRPLIREKERRDVLIRSAAAAAAVIAAYFIFGAN